MDPGGRVSAHYIERNLYPMKRTGRPEGFMAPTLRGVDVWVGVAECQALSWKCSILDAGHMRPPSGGVAAAWLRSWAVGLGGGS